VYKNYFASSLCLIVFATFSELLIAEEKCDLSQKLFDASFSKISNGTYEIEANQSLIEKKDIFRLSGDVKIKSSNVFISGNDISINKTNETITSFSPINFKNNELEFTASNLTYNKTNIDASDTEFIFNQLQYRGSAEKLNTSDIAKKLSGASITSCPLLDNDWIIEADSIYIDNANNTGSAKNAKIKLFGIPIFYFPELSWVLSGRGSGFLIPSISTYKNYLTGSSETKLSVPYYFNIAKDKDLLIDLTNYSDRGASIYSNYRQLLSQNEFWEEGKIDLINEYIAHDKLTNNARWFSNNEIQLKLNQNSNLVLNNKRVSDINFSKDFHTDTASENLLSYIDYNYYDDFEFSLRVENEQVVDSSSSSYFKAPEISFSKQVNSESINSKFEFNSSKFKSKITENKEGLRNKLDIEFSKKYNLGGLSLTPTISENFTNYQLQSDTKIDRSISSFYLPASMEFQRNFNIGKKYFNQSFSPKFLYRFTDFESQSSIPNFDTNSLTSQIYHFYDTDNKDFTGIDKINAENSLSYGFETNIVNVDTNNLINFGVSQKINFNKKKIDLLGNTLFTDNFSNIFFTSDINFQEINLSSAFSHNPYNGNMQESSISINYSPYVNKFFGIDHINNEDKSIVLYAGYPITSEISFFGSMNRNLSLSKNEKEMYGLSYENCCWEAKLVKFNDSNDSSRSGLSFEFVFKELVSTSPSLTNRIKAEIPNFLKLYDY